MYQDEDLAQVVWCAFVDVEPRYVSATEDGERDLPALAIDGIHGHDGEGGEPIKIRIMVPLHTPELFGWLEKLKEIEVKEASAG